MISNKIVATLFFITINIQLVASTSPSDTLKQNSSGEPTFLVKRRRRASRRGTTPKLHDTTSVVKPVEVQENSTEETSTLQGTASEIGETAPVLQVATSTVEDVLPVNNQVTTRVSLCLRLYYWIMEPIVEKFERLFGQKKYDEMLNIRDKLEPNKFLLQIYPLVKTLEQYNGISGCLKHHKVVAPFYVYGDMRVVKEIIVTKWTVNDVNYKHGGDLENALDLALKEDRHDRFIELLKIRRDITAEEDKLRPGSSSFGRIVYWFLHHLDLQEYGMALKRFLTLRGDELRSENPDIFDILCQELVRHLRYQLREPCAKKFLTDLIGQPSILTPVAFAKEFLYSSDDMHLCAFTGYGWKEAIEESLNMKSGYGGKWLWIMLTKGRPDRSFWTYPPSNAALDAVLTAFPTKQQMEERWAERNPISNISERLETLITDAIPTKVLVKIIIEYADLKPTWIDIQNTKSS